MRCLNDGRIAWCMHLNGWFPDNINIIENAKWNVNTEVKNEQTNRKNVLFDIKACKITFHQMRHTQRLQTTRFDMISYDIATMKKSNSNYNTQSERIESFENLTLNAQTIGVEYIQKCNKMLHVFNFCIGLGTRKKQQQQQPQRKAPSDNRPPRKRNKPCATLLCLLLLTRAPKRVSNMIYCVHSHSWSCCVSDLFLIVWKTNKKINAKGNNQRHLIDPLFVRRWV